MTADPVRAASAAADALAVVLPASLVEQVAQVAAGFALKPAYMALALVLAVLLRRRSDRALVLVRRGLYAFFAGEAACAANWALGGSPADALEILHGLGMVAMGALVPFGLFELFDERVWRFTAHSAPCGAVRLCGRCWKTERVPCAMQRLFLFAIPALAVLALLPLTASIRPLDVTVLVFGTPVPHLASAVVQAFQFRVLPLAAVAAFGVALALVASGERGVRRAPPWFFAGFGALVFVLLRFALQSAYRTMPVWSDFWEEATEMVAVAGVAVVLWVVWKPLGLPGAEPAAQPGAQA